MALALEVEHGVDDVLERLRSGEAAVLRDVADEERRHVLALRREQQLRGRLAHLADAAGRRLKLQREDRLNGVDDDERRLDAGDLLEDPLETGFGEQIQRRVADREPLAARLDLMLGLFAGAVEHRARPCAPCSRPPAAAASTCRCPARRRAARAIRARCRRRARDRTRRCRSRAARAVRCSMSAYSRAAPRRRRRARSDGRRAAPARLRRPLLDERVPRAAVRAPAEPLRRLRAALLADEDGLGCFSSGSES